MAHSTISSFYFWTMLTTIATHFCHNSTAFVGKLPRISDDFFIDSTCHKKFTFSKLDIEEENKKKLALATAIFTAPYIFLFPIELFIYD